MSAGIVVVVVVVVVEAVVRRISRRSSDCRNCSIDLPFFLGLCVCVQEPVL